MITYLLESGLAVAVFWLYYYLVLRRTTFFTLNRYYLLGGLIFSLVLPFLDYSAFWGSYKTIESVPLDFYYDTASTIDVFKGKIVKVSSSSQVLSKWIFTIYSIGVGIFIIRFIYSIVSIIRLGRRSEKVTIDGHVVYLVKGISQPFSIFKTIFFPAHWKDIPKEILLHEAEHGTNYHTIDLILAEAIQIFMWYNPMVYLFKKSIKLNLEYLADRAVLNEDVDPLQYTRLLITTALESSIKHPITTHFATPIKNRLTMIKKTKTQNWLRLSILGALPLAFTLTSMSNGVKELAPQSEAVFFTDVASDEKPIGYPIAEAEVLNISSEYGLKMHPILKVEKLHSGIDIVAKEGTPVVSTADGVIISAEFDSAKGNFVLIKHGDQYSTQYSHLSKLVVPAGISIKKGEVIGYVGSTGQSTGPHLHYEVHQDSKPVNPKSYME